ncbi:MAG: 2'-5' RNA ligase family protein [Burkholderiaceae bacterium]
MKARYFYALRPDAGAARRLGALAARLASSLGGRPMSAGDVHLTLVFVGERPAEDEATLASLLDGLASCWPAMPLTRLGTFGRGLFWAGPANPRGAPEGDAGTLAWPAQLAAQLQQRLRDAGIAFDERALHLHATLVRGARRDARNPLPPFADALPIEPGSWTLALGCSEAGSTPLRRYRWRDAPR